MKVALSQLVSLGVVVTIAAVGHAAPVPLSQHDELEARMTLPESVSKPLSQLSSSANGVESLATTAKEAGEAAPSSSELLAHGYYEALLRGDYDAQLFHDNPAVGRGEAQTSQQGDTPGSPTQTLDISNLLDGGYDLHLFDDFGPEASTATSTAAKRTRRKLSSQYTGDDNDPEWLTRAQLAKIPLAKRQRYRNKMLRRRQKNAPNPDAGSRRGRPVGSKNVATRVLKDIKHLTKEGQRARKRRMKMGEEQLQDSDRFHALRRKRRKQGDMLGPADAAELKELESKMTTTTTTTSPKDVELHAASPAPGNNASNTHETQISAASESNNGEDWINSILSTP